jgi:GNAT superfamily N-acetyltransferase
MTLNIRYLREDDALVISLAFSRIGWSKPVSQYKAYYRQQEANQSTVLIAEIDDQFAGYLKIAWKPEYVLFEERNIPEIQDLNVLPEFRRRGVASALMDDAEVMIARTSPEVGIGVGLHPGYNVAQRMYVRRGYVPDGRGVMWRGKFITEGQNIIADDDLVLHLTKKLEVTS